MGHIREVLVKGSQPVVSKVPQTMPHRENLLAPSSQETRPHIPILHFLVRATPSWREKGLLRLNEKLAF
jgi:hypothetical protein